MFKHEHHRKLLSVLHRLRPEIVEACGLVFAGGTALAMEYGEYRLSRDLDFLAAGEGYRHARGVLFDGGARALFRSTEAESVFSVGEARRDAYAIRFPIHIGPDTIKMEIIHEARIALDEPRRLESLPVPLLTVEDQFAEKVLANADRGLDRALRSRVLIDLGALGAHHEAPSFLSGLDKATVVYPEAIAALHRTLVAFNVSAYRAECFDAHRIDAVDRQVVETGLRRICAWSTWSSADFCRDASPTRCGPKSW